MDAQLPEAPPGEWRPQPKQERFLRLACFEALYGGAAGGGKSDALLLGATRLREQPHHRALIVRREYKELQRTLLERSFELYPRMGGRWSEKRSRWKWDSGATVEFGHSENERDVEKYDGSAYNWIGVDELTHWTERMYRFLISRCRSAHGLPLRMRATSNPGGIGHDWVLRCWAPWLYPAGHDEYRGVRAREGEVLYFRPREGKVDAEDQVARGELGAIGRSFVGARVADNRFLAGTEYETTLARLDPFTRAQKRDGDWMARPGRRVFFKREWFLEVAWEDVPWDDIVLVRYWDRAATEDPKADWTVGLLVGYQQSTGLWFIIDSVRGQWEPAKVESEIKKQAIRDDNHFGLVRLVLERDPAQAGKFQARYDVRALAGHDVHASPPQGDKVTRAKPASAQAEQGNMRIVRGAWNRTFLDVLESFPDPPDDDVDALSGAFRHSLQYARSGVRRGGRREMTPDRAGGY